MGTAITYYLSPDNGMHWESVTPGVEHLFTHVGSELRWRAVLITSAALVAPLLTGVIIAYETRLNGPDLVSPDDAVGTNDNTPAFAWTAVAGASHYLLQLDTMTSFNTFLLRNVTVAGGTTSYTPVSPLADGTWYWRVAANDSKGNLGAFSAPRSLYVHASPPTWDQAPTNQLLRLGSPFRYDVNASDPVGIDHCWVNDTTHFAIDTAGVITNAASLSMDVYEVEVRAYDAYMNYCSATFSITVQVETTTPPIPGFPMDATGLGLVVALGTLVAVRRHRRKP